MTQAEFSNALRVLHSLDAHELVGVSASVARAFVDQPVRTFIRADDATAAAIWAAVTERTRPVTAAAKGPEASPGHPEQLALREAA